MGKANQLTANVAKATGDICSRDSFYRVILTAGGFLCTSEASPQASDLIKDRIFLQIIVPKNNKLNLSFVVLYVRRHAGAFQPVYQIKVMEMFTKGDKDTFKLQVELNKLHSDK